MLLLEVLDNKEGETVTAKRETRTASLSDSASSATATGG